MRAATGRAAVTAALAGLMLAAAAGGVQAAPAIHGASVHLAPGAAACPEDFCLRVTFRASEAGQYPGEILRWRVTARRASDGLRVGNWAGTFPNHPEPNTWWMWSGHRPAAGRYVVRIAVASGRGTAVRERTVRVP